MEYDSKEGIPGTITIICFYSKTNLEAASWIPHGFRISDRFAEKENRFMKIGPPHEYLLQILQDESCKKIVQDLNMDSNGYRYLEFQLLHPKDVNKNSGRPKEPKYPTVEEIVKELEESKEITSYIVFLGTPQGFESINKYIEERIAQFIYNSIKVISASEEILIEMDLLNNLERMVLEKSGLLKRL